MAVFRQRLRDLLEKQPFHTGADQASELSPEAEEKLRALGYFAYRSPVPQSTLLAGLADPKSKLAEFNEFMEAEDAIRAANFSRGRELLDAIREKDPEMYIVPFHLGKAARAQQRWEEASVEFRNCLQLNPQFEPAMTGLAEALAFQGKAEEAKQWAEKAVALNPQDYQALYVLGFLESQVDRKRAITYYNSAAAIQPSYAPLQRDLGLLELQEGNFAASADHLEKAVELGVNEASIFNSLGIAYGRTNRSHKAVEAYKRALALSPDTAEIHLNLASAYDRLQRSKEAKVEYGVACKLNARYCQ